MKFIYITLSALLTLSSAYAEDRFTNSDALATVAGQGVAYAAAPAAYMVAGENIVMKMSSKTIINNNVSPVILSDIDIKKIVSQASDYGRLGIGDLGGATLEITYDAQTAESIIAMQNLDKKLSNLPLEKINAAAEDLQSKSNVRTGFIGDIRKGEIAKEEIDKTAIVNNAIDEARNHRVKFSTRTIDIRNMSGDKLAAQLQELSKIGAVVKEVKLISFAGKATRRTAEVASIASLLMAVDRGIHSAGIVLSLADEDVNLNTAYCEKSVVCSKPSFFKKIFNGAAQSAYDRDAELKLVDPAQ